MKVPCFWTTPLGLCHLIVALLFLHGSVLFQTHAVQMVVKSETMCLYVKLNVGFSIIYETENNEYKRTEFALPDDTNIVASDCGGHYSNILSVKFGQNNYWIFVFTKYGDTYEGTVSFTYNTNDTVLFPDAKRKGPLTVTVKYPEHPIPLNMVFICDGLKTIQDHNVTMHISQVTLEAFILAGVLSKAKTHCIQDAPATHEEPRGRPATGWYSVQKDGKICLLLTMTLQVHILEKAAEALLNFHPNTTEASGTCGNTTSSMTLKDGNKEITFRFPVLSSYILCEILAWA